MIRSIIISGPPAVGKTTMAEGLAKEFNLQYLSGGDALKVIAKERGFNSNGKDWWDTTDGIKFLNQRRKNFEFDKIVDSKLKQFFCSGNVVITSYTLPWLVSGGIKIWLLCSYKNSAERMKIRDNVPIEKALEIVKKRYNDNRLLYKKLYNIQFGDDTSIFDKIINTNCLNSFQVLEIAKSIVRKIF